MAVDSTDAPREIQAAGAWRFIESVSHDGRTLLYGDVGSDTGWDLWAQPLDAGAPARKLFASSFQERYARLSPDGRTLVFTSDESGRSEVYAVTYPDLGHRVQVSTAGGSEPVWAHSGREVFYRADDAVVVVSIDTAASLTAGTPVTLFETPLIRGNALIRSYDVLPGDRGFVVIRAVSGRESAHVQVVQNWPEEVKAKVSSR
jgi:Tol biopolymer transport system component